MKDAFSLQGGINAIHPPKAISLENNEVMGIYGVYVAPKSWTTSSAQILGTT